MNDFQLNIRLAEDTYPVLESEDYCLLLNKNALVPWLILVPKTNETELFACEPEFKRCIRETMDALAVFVQDYTCADKMNVAALGNVVSQLHIHIIARKSSDFAWPDPVWGKPDFLAYDDVKKDAMIAALQQFLTENK